MNLYFKILWFEDDYELVHDEIGPEIKIYLENLGFAIDLTYSENGDSLDELIYKKKYDLILTDLNLGDGHEAGEKLIEYIRSHKILTEVLLYSGNAEGINTVIKGHDLIERVSFSIGIENLNDKIKKIILLAIKKVQEVNNVRGLVMAETCELDYKMLGILLKFYEKIDAEDKLRFENYIFDITEDSFKSSYKKIEKLKEAHDIKELVHTPIFDSDKKRRTVNKMLEIIANTKIDVPKNCMDDYKEEILTIRNVLAHVKEEMDSNGEVYLRSLIKGYETIIFNDEFCIKIRNDIRKHSNNLDKIFDVLDISFCKPKEIIDDKVNSNLG
jgi:hypothetical protein